MRNLTNMIGKKTIAFLFVTVWAVGWFLYSLVPKPAYSSISINDLKQKIDKGDNSYIILDTRPRSYFNLGHIGGAVSFATDTELESRFFGFSQVLKEEKLEKYLKMNKPFVIYGQTDGDKATVDMARMLVGKRSNVLILQGGWFGWRSYFQYVSQTPALGVIDLSKYLEPAQL